MTKRTFTIKIVATFDDLPKVISESALKDLYAVYVKNSTVMFKPTIKITQCKEWKKRGRKS